MLSKRVLIIFLDGVGLGVADPKANPFMQVDMPAMQALFNVAHLSQDAAGTITEHVALLGLDATLGVSGLPQSATGQTSILTGQNAAALLGRHIGPYPTAELRNLLATDSLFQTIQAANFAAAYANAYPTRFLERLERGKGRLSANTSAARMAGLRLRNHEDLQQGQAISALLSNSYWPEPDVDLPPLNAYQAGEQLVALSTTYTLTFFEFWYTDMLGHKMEREASLELLVQLDAFLAGTLARLDLDRTLLLVISDHGNFEDWTTKKHTTNPALTILAGNKVATWAPRLRTLIDIKPVILDYLFAEA